MVNIVQGAALQPFAGQALPRHDLPGPGPKAFKILRGTQQTSYLVSTGVYDCAILTIILPRQVLPRQPGVRVTIGGQRSDGVRAMAHFNPFSGPKQSEIAALFKSCLADHVGSVNDLTVEISYNSGARRPYTQALANLVGLAVPGLLQVVTRGFGVASPQGQATRAVAIYLSSGGQLSALQA